MVTATTTCVYYLIAADITVALLYWTTLQLLPTSVIAEVLCDAISNSILPSKYEFNNYVAYVSFVIGMPKF